MCLYAHVWTSDRIHERSATLQCMHVSMFIRYYAPMTGRTHADSALYDTTLLLLSYTSQHMQINISCKRLASLLEHFVAAATAVTAVTIAVTAVIAVAAAAVAELSAARCGAAIEAEG
jgi:hypothetical protein